MSQQQKEGLNFVITRCGFLCPTGVIPTRQLEDILVCFAKHLDTLIKVLACLIVRFTLRFSNFLYVRQ